MYVLVNLMNVSNIINSIRLDLIRI